MNFKITYKSGSEEVVSGATWQDAMRRNNLIGKTRFMRSVKAIRERNPQPQLPKPRNSIDLYLDSQNVRTTDKFGNPMTTVERVKYAMKELWERGEEYRKALDIVKENM